jgi:5'-nucleotidase
MPAVLDDKLVIAISSRALFDLDASHQVYVEQGLDAFAQYQLAHEDDVLKPGDAFGFVQKLLRLNQFLAVGGVEVILLSRNTADTGLRIFNSIEHYGLGISRAAFCGGQSPHRYVGAFNIHLFLSTDENDVTDALAQGVAAATLLPSRTTLDDDPIVRIAFDGDAVLFSDEAEQVFQSNGLDAFSASEKSAARSPLHGGPFKPFLAALHALQQNLTDKTLLRTALVTARSAPAHERVIRTLRDWNIRLDEALFLGGLKKAEFLRAFHADVFFDDQRSHCEGAREHVATGHVPFGVTNLRTKAN